MDSLTLIGRTCTILDINEIIKQANNADFTPSQKAFDLAAKTFVHAAPPPKKPKMSAVTGKYKRHLFRKAKGVKEGFGTPLIDRVSFRVELNWFDKETEEETNEQTHWVECKKFSGKQYQFYKNYFSKAKSHWSEGETVESEFVCRYIGNWLMLNRHKWHLNQAFVFPSSPKRDDKIRDLIYQIRWTGEYSEYSEDLDLKIVLKKNIIHDR